MIKKKSILILLNIFFIFFNCQKNENPINICKDCGSFDLNKVKFTENILELTSKTEVTKSTLNSNNDPSELKGNVGESKSGDFLKYSFLNDKNLKLGKTPFNYNNQFNFNQLNILVDSKNKIIVLDATIFYDGKIEDITKFVDYLKKGNKAAKMIIGKMYGDLTVYQWFLNDKIIQLVKDNEEGTEEQTINGKTTKTRSTYLKLNIYNRPLLTNSITSVIGQDSDFVLYDKKYYAN